jgi:two-component system, NtrC family, sensor kinase
MSATADQELAELRRANAKLLKERDAALAEAQARSVALSLRNSEYGERIEQQAATIEVLKAMSASPGNPQPVFDLIVERARVCCNAELAAMTLLDGDLLRLEATSSMTAAKTEQFAKAYPLHVSQAFAGGRAILLRDTVQIPDTKLDPGFAHRGTNDWHRSVLAVPLLRTGRPIGAIGLGRSIPGTFSQTQVELLKTFAEQAVIAITSAETYHELQERTAALARRNDEFGERIEHQSATIDVLKAMSASPGDKKPIFDLIVRRAVELCNAQSGGLFEYDGNLVSIGTIHGLFEHNGELVPVKTLQGNEQDIKPSALRTYLRQFPMAPSRGSVSMRAILDSQLLHIRDMSTEDLIDDVRRLGHRSQVSVPLRQSGRAIGVITMAAHEPGGFSDSQVALLQTFAEQAAIAITSAETYRALQEQIEHQSATTMCLRRCPPRRTIPDLYSS